MMMSENPRKLKCPVCENENFEHDEVVLAKYGMFRMSDYKAKMVICTQCKYIMLFEAGSTFFLGVD